MKDVLLDLQVIMDVGHVGTILKSLLVTGFCFFVLALHTQDVSQVPISCLSKQKKHCIGIVFPAFSRQNVGTMDIKGSNEEGLT
jgi:hypothetical protein